MALAAIWVGTSGSVAGLVGLDVLGIVNWAEQAGHSIWVPAPELSTANSWSQFGQLKMMSIKKESLRFQKANPVPYREPAKNANFITSINHRPI
jgi:hypothetical protein